MCQHTITYHLCHEVFSQSRAFSKCVHFHGFDTFRNHKLSLHCHCKNSNKHSVFQFEIYIFRMFAFNYLYSLCLSSDLCAFINH